MYQQPTLSEIGDVTEVVRGTIATGFDLDDTRIIEGHEFQFDAECDSTNCE